jgi:ParB/RepB/Spo0J family partition protein
MAKRKRLTPAVFSNLPDDLETKSRVFAPIANVAADAATQAALSDVVESLTKARREGRMVLELDPASIDAAYLVRDRTRVDPEEMERLSVSIAQRGQQSPIEVVDLRPGTAPGTGTQAGRYGLISGWRRLSAVRALADRPVLALLRVPQDAPDAYLAMIEENEIRVGLSYYERARIVVKSVAGGVFATNKAALQSLFRSASRAKRSKIKSFLAVVEQLDGALQFPEELGERLGLTLSKALEADATLAPRLMGALAADTLGDAAAEQALIQALIKGKSGQDTKDGQTADPAVSQTRRLTQGLRAETRTDGSLLLSGPALTSLLTRQLQDWLRQRVDLNSHK